MSVLIKGMEMPEKCSDCWMCQNSGGTYELGDDFCCIGEVEIKDSSVRQASCPLVSVLPHGRLIDADELKEWVENWLYKDRYYHNGRVSKTIPVTELYDILEQISMEVEE